MVTESDISSRQTSGISALVLMLRFHGIAVDARQLMHQYGDIIGTTEILRCAKDLKLKCRSIDSNWDRLARTALPAIAEHRDGGFFIISKVASSHALILDPVAGHPRSIDRGELESRWSG